MQDEFSGNVSFVVAAAMFEGGMAVLAVSIGWVFGRQPLDTFQFNAIGLLWGVLATIPPLFVLCICLIAPWRPFIKIIQLLQETFIPLFRQCGLYELAGIALLAGLGEELLFRSIVQGWIADKIGPPYGIYLGLAISAVIFGTLHGITLTYALLAGVIGLYFGVIWLATGNLLVPIASHALYDFLALMYFIRIHKPAPKSPEGKETNENLLK